MHTDVHHIARMHAQQSARAGQDLGEHDASWPYHGCKFFAFFEQASLLQRYMKAGDIVTFA